MSIYANITTYVVVAILVLLTTGGDWFLKTGSMQNSSYASWQTQVGAIMYLLTAYGWVYVMQKLNLTQVGVLYSSMTIIILTAMSLIIFKEDVSTRQLLGAALALAAVIVTIE